MPNPEVVTNFKDSDGVDLGKKLISKDYLISVYPQIADQLITPELWTWGSNGSGQLGVNDTTNRLTPVTTLSGGSNWKQVSVGYHCTAIKTDGTLWTWGYNVSGQLGTNDTANRSTPVTTFAGGTNWKQVSAGGQEHTAAIKTDGTLWVWGRDGNGALGTNGGGDKYTPVTTFAGGTNWKQVSGGVNHTAAIKTDGTLWVWGGNNFQPLGINGGFSATPVTTFAGGTNWKQVTANWFHTAAIKTDGTLWTWGRNYTGELGTNDNTQRLTPVTTFAGGTNWKQVGSGYGSVRAIKTDGTLWNWGQGAFGNLGINGGSSQTPVTTFAGGTNWKQFSSVLLSLSCAAIKTDGTLWTWGYNGGEGRLGTNDTTNRLTPVTTFAGGTNWKQVANSPGNTIAIKTSDDLIGI
jgi:alpha-tubulin suppressor-like RCC1 family protein